MAVRLGTQDWINPGPFQAAAEMVVDAGRATGAGIAALGAGIGQGLQNRQARQERAQNRQDALDQRGIDNARADRAEARVVAEGKLDFLQKNVAASQIEFEMMRTRYEMDGSSESEAAMNQSAQKVKTAIDLYKMGLGTHGGVVQPHGAPTTDYVGVGNGVAVNGKPTSQMTDAELDDLMAKSERGEVDYTYRGGATGDMGQGVGGAAVRPRAASPEVGSFTFPAEVDTADEYAQVASQLLAEAALVESSAGHLKPSSRAASAAKGRAAVLRQRAAFANFRAGTLADEAKATREQAERVAEEQRKAAEGKAELDAINEGRKADGLKPVASLRQVGPQMTRERMDAGREDTQQHQKDMASIKDANARGRMLESEGIKKRLIDYAVANGKADDPRFKMLNVLHDNATEEAYRYFSAAGNDTLPKAAVDALMKQGDAEMNRAKEITKQMAMVFEGAAAPKAAAPAPASAAGGAPAAPASGTYPSWMPNDPEKRARWDALPDVEKQKVIKVKGQ